VEGATGPAERPLGLVRLGPRGARGLQRRLGPADGRRALLEILEDRHGRAATIVTSQLPVDLWHQTIGDPTLADAILDRLIHNTHRLELDGESMRKRAATAKKIDHRAEA